MLGDTGPARHARAGFLEGEAIETPPPIGLQIQHRAANRRRDPSAGFSLLGSGIAWGALQENRPV